jgi:hypothetical protein
LILLRKPHRNTYLGLTEDLEPLWVLTEIIPSGPSVSIKLFKDQNPLEVSGGDITGSEMNNEYRLGFQISLRSQGWRSKGKNQCLLGTPGCDPGK